MLFGSVNNIIVWVSKYRFGILKGPVAEEFYKIIHIHYVRMDCEVIELNIQGDYVYLLVSMPPKESVSKLLGTVKAKISI
jgi:putative transposase